MDFFLNINKDISSYLNNFVLTNNLGDLIGKLADLPIFFLPIFLLGTRSFYTFKNKNIDKKKDLLLIFYGVVLSVAINLIIQKFFPTQRPDTFIKPILDHIPDNSFPSDHAAVSMAFVTGLFLANYKRISQAFFVFVVMMLFSRIAGGLHWFFDIIIGSIIGIISSIFVFKYLKKTKYINTLSDFIIKIMNYFKF